MKKFCLKIIALTAFIVFEIFLFAAAFQHMMSSFETYTLMDVMGAILFAIAADTISLGVMGILIIVIVEICRIVHDWYLEGLFDEKSKDCEVHEAVRIVNPESIIKVSESYRANVELKDSEDLKFSDKNSITYVFDEDEGYYEIKVGIKPYINTNVPASVKALNEEIKWLGENLIRSFGNYMKNYDYGFSDNFSKYQKDTRDETMKENGLEIFDFKTGDQYE